MAVASLAELRENIRKERRYVNVKEFSHQVVSFTLLTIDKQFGTEEANRAIRDFKLKELGWDEQ